MMEEEKQERKKSSSEVIFSSEEVKELIKVGLGASDKISLGLYNKLDPKEEKS